jgi:hypothetical protein
MCTPQERYDIERAKEVKNVPLLKTLKELIAKSCNVAAKIAQIRLQLQEAEFAEDWDAYAQLQTTLTHIEGVDNVKDVHDDVTNVVDEGVLLAARANVATDDLEVVREVVHDAFVLTAGTDERNEATSITSADSNDEDDVIMNDINLRRGSTFASPQLLLLKVSEYATSLNFTVRREKHAIVCSNAGESNWTSVTNYEARAQQAFRKIQKLKDQDANDNIEDLLQSEEDKVAP